MRKLKFIVDKAGQWKNPGKLTMIPNAGGRITMKGVKQKLLGIDDQGNKMLMLPNKEYQFPGNNVFEIPIKKKGGTKRSLKKTVSTKRKLQNGGTAKKLKDVKSSAAGKLQRKTGKPSYEAVGTEYTKVDKLPDWSRHSQKYEKDLPRSKYIDIQKEKYLTNQAYPGFVKGLGLDKQNFPQNVEQQYNNEYDIAKNNYIVENTFKERGWDPKKRTEWVDNLTDTERNIVKNSKYGHHLEPSVGSTTLSGAATLANYLLPKSLEQKSIPGLTEKEFDKSNVLQTFDFLNYPGTVANAAITNWQNTGDMFYGTARNKHIPLLTGQHDPNRPFGQEELLNPINWTLAADAAGLISGASKILANPKTLSFFSKLWSKGKPKVLSGIEPTALLNKLSSTEVTKDIKSVLDVDFQVPVETQYSLKDESLLVHKKLENQASIDEVTDILQHWMYKDPTKFKDVDKLTKEIDILDKGVKRVKSKTTIGSRAEKFNNSNNRLSLLKSYLQEKSLDMTDPWVIKTIKDYNADPINYVKTLEDLNLKNLDELEKYGDEFTINFHRRKTPSPENEAKFHNAIEKYKLDYSKKRDKLQEKLSKKFSKIDLHPSFVEKVNNLYTMAGQTSPGEILNPYSRGLKDRSLVIYPGTADEGMDALSSYQKNYVKENIETIRGTRFDDKNITFGVNPKGWAATYKGVYPLEKQQQMSFNLFNPMSWKKSLLNKVSDTPTKIIKDIPLEYRDASDILKTIAHEQGHDIQKVGEWGKLIAPYSDKYKYFSNQGDNPLSRLFRRKMTEPTLPTGDEHTYETWLSSGNELHSDLVAERVKSIIDIKKEYKFNTKKAVAFFRKHEDDFNESILKEGELHKFFKNTTNITGKKNLIKILPSVAGTLGTGAIGAGIGTKFLSEQKQGGNINKRKLQGGGGTFLLPSRYTTMPQDNTKFIPQGPSVEDKFRISNMHKDIRNDIPPTHFQVKYGIDPQEFIDNNKEAFKIKPLPYLNRYVKKENATIRPGIEKNNIMAQYFDPEKGEIDYKKALYELPWNLIMAASMTPKGGVKVPVKQNVSSNFRYQNYSTPRTKPLVKSLIDIAKDMDNFKIVPKSKATTADLQRMLDDLKGFTKDIQANMTPEQIKSAKESIKPKNKTSDEQAKDALARSLAYINKNLGKGSIKLDIDALNKLLKSKETDSRLGTSKDIKDGKHVIQGSKDDPYFLYGKDPDIPGFLNLHNIIKDYPTWRPMNRPDNMGGQGSYNINEQIRRLQPFLQYGKRPLITKDQFFSNTDIKNMSKQEKDYYKALDQYEKTTPWSGSNFMMNLFSRQDPHMDTFHNLNPNVSLPKWQSKFTFDPKVMKYVNQNPRSESGLSKPMLSVLTRNNSMDQITNTGKDLLKKDDWYHSASAKDYVSEMRGSTGLTLEQIRNMSNEQLIPIAKKIYDNLKKQQLERYKIDVGTPYTARQAWHTVSPNKFGGNINKRKLQNGGWVPKKGSDKANTILKQFGNKYTYEELMASKLRPSFKDEADFDKKYNIVTTTLAKNRAINYNPNINIKQLIQKPIYTNNPNDPRLIAYRDSSDLYNKGEDDKTFYMENLKDYEYNPYDESYLISYKPENKNQKIQPILSTKLQTIRKQKYNNITPEEYDKLLSNVTLTGVGIDDDTDYIYKGKNKEIYADRGTYDILNEGYDTYRKPVQPYIFRSDSRTTSIPTPTSIPIGIPSLLRNKTETQTYLPKKKSTPIKTKEVINQNVQPNIDIQPTLPEPKPKPTPIPFNEKGWGKYWDNTAIYDNKQMNIGTVGNYYSNHITGERLTSDEYNEAKKSGVMPTGTFKERDLANKKAKGLYLYSFGGNVIKRKLQGGGETDPEEEEKARIKHKYIKENVKNWEEPNYKIVDNNHHIGYDGIDTIYYDPNSEWENINNPSWLEHERYHHFQNLTGRNKTGNNWRRDVDLQNQIDEMIKQNPSLKGIPREMLIKGYKQTGTDKGFIGADELMYNNPNTLEGEGRIYEDYITNKGESIFPLLDINKIKTRKLKKQNGGGTDPVNEEKYQTWRSQLPKNLQYEGEYDLRGFYEENPNFVVSDPDQHLTDKFKLPSHPTFSTESKYYKQGMPAGKWVGNKYIPINRYFNRP